MLKKQVILIFALLTLAPLVNGQNEKVIIEKGTRGGGRYPLGERAYLDVKIDGERGYLLVCVLSHADCRELPPGEYEIARLIPGEGSYKDCPNVDIYRVGADRLKEKPLGEYCLDHVQS
jgi:hypothetical protein